MKVASLFTGIGGFDVGADDAGMRIVAQVERDAACRSVLRRHWPKAELFEDVKEFSAKPFRPDVVCGGFPCQDLSVAGRRAGLAGERSGLWFEFLRIVTESTPGWVLIENVPGLLSSQEGRDFACLVSGLDDLGYGIAWRVFDSQWHGVAQRRRRVFIIGCFGDVRRAGEILFEREGLPWDSPPSREAGTNSSEDVGSCLKASGQYDHVGDESRLVITHTLRAEGADASEGGTGRGTPLVPVAFQASDYRTGQFEQEPTARPLTTSAARPLTTSADRSRAAPIVAEPFVFQTRCARNGRGMPSEIVPALNSCEGGTHADAKPHIAGGGYGVRRLTPKECERLQGFADDWTRYADDNAEISDSARYRMLGNAVTVNVARWIFNRIAKAGA